MSLLKDRTEGFEPLNRRFVRMAHRSLVGNFNWLQTLLQKPDGLSKSTVLPSTFNFNQLTLTGISEVTGRELQATGMSANFQHIGIFNSDLGQIVCSKSLGGVMR